MANDTQVPERQFLTALSDFPEGDNKNYIWSTRLSKGAHQFLSDLQSEWRLGSNSNTLRTVIKILYNYIDQLPGVTLTGRVKAWTLYMRAKHRKVQLDEIRADLYQTAISIANEVNLPIRLRLEATAKALAKEYGIPWPPPEVPLIHRDKEADYALDRFIWIAQTENTNTVTLRDFVRRTVFDADTARQVIKRLEEHQYISTREVSRSGRPTLYIYLPSIKTKAESTV